MAAIAGAAGRRVITITERRPTFSKHSLAGSRLLPAIFVAGRFAIKRIARPARNATEGVPYRLRDREGNSDEVGAGFVVHAVEHIDLEGPGEVVAGAVFQRGIGDNIQLTRRPRLSRAKFPAALFLAERD